MIDQSELMRFDPVDGSPRPYPSNADQYREFHGSVAWLFDPWNGTKRDPRDIGSDVLGLLIFPSEPVLELNAINSEKERIADPVLKWSGIIPMDEYLWYNGPPRYG